MQAFASMFVIFVSLLMVIIMPLESWSDDAAEDLLRLASAAEAAGDSAKAVDLATQAIAKDAKLSGAYYLRGREHFRLGKIKESVADFDKYVELRPELAPRQWERGISYYYAGEFKKGAKQFELYQTFHDNDVENSTWRFLCVARTNGIEKARATILPIKNDPRVPMMQILEMFRGKVTADEVLQAAQQGDPGKMAMNRRLFYAHLYIGLLYEALGEKELAKKHIVTAADDHKIGHYMWDVARVHADLLKRDDNTAGEQNKESRN